MFFAPELLYGIGTLLLGLAIAWGVYRYMTRNKANDPITEEATRESYGKSPEEYAKERKELQRQIKP